MNDYVITTNGLGKRFKRHWAVQDLSLQVPTGSVFGLLGPNGAGKSTTINMLMGLLPPNTGRISVFGLDPERDDVAIRQKVGYVPEQYGFYDWMKVDELINLVAAYHDTWDWQHSRALQSDFKLNGQEQVKNLSKGMRAKLALLLALAFNPELLVLDEPTGGLDPAARRNFIETILGHYQETGKTIFVSSHLLNEFSGLLDHVAFMKDGTLQLVTKLDALQQRMKRARLVFPEQIPDNLKIDGTVAKRLNGREAVITINNFDPEKSPAELSKTGASNVSFEEMTLEDIFVDLVGTS